MGEACYKPVAIDHGHLLGRHLFRGPRSRGSWGIGVGVTGEASDSTLRSAVAGAWCRVVGRKYLFPLGIVGLGRGYFLARSKNNLGFQGLFRKLYTCHNLLRAKLSLASMQSWALLRIYAV